MKHLFQTLFSKSFILLASVFTIFLVGSLGDTVLYAGAKKNKHVKHKKKDLKRKYDTLRDDYEYTVTNFVFLLDQLSDVLKDHEIRLQKLQTHSIYQDQNILSIREYLYQKSMDPTFCPFDLLKKWYEEPFNVNLVDEDRHMHIDDTVSE